MKILVYLHHPAHFHLFKNVLSKLRFEHEIIVLATKKDILEQLLKNAGIPYFNILPEGRRDNKFSIALGLLKQDIRLLNICLKKKPDLLVGTSTEIAHIGRLLNIKSIFVNEDDINVVPLVGKLAYPFAETIVVPDVCDVGKFNYKTVFYSSYHELAYLHPNHFTPLKNVVQKYFSPDIPYFIIRFAKLEAHHDKGIKGIDTNIAKDIIRLLSKEGDIYISSERELEEEYEKYRINISPNDMHHVMAFSNLYIGDSQTMAAEAGVLGVPFIRYNDFVGRIGYLRELEEKYQLGYGIKPPNPTMLLKKLKELLLTNDREELFKGRRNNMLLDKIDYSKFLTWFIENYPTSADIMKENPEYQHRFR